MAKKALVEKNKKCILLIAKFRSKRSELRKKIKDKSITMKERASLQSQLNALPLSSSASRYRNRCRFTGRPRGYYRKFGISRIQLRSCANWGLLPGVVKSSW